MEKTKTYRNVRFSADVIREASREFQSLLCDDESVAFRNELEISDGTTYKFDTLAEFLSDFRHPNSQGFVTFSCDGATLSIRYFDIINVHNQHVQQSVISVSAVDRGQIESIFEIFERNRELCHIDVPSEPAAQAPTIFIGHGIKSQWRDLKDHLHEKHDFTVTAYEVGARAGHVIRDILEDMLTESSFALLVMTAEDELSTGKFRPRENVVHEAGLFQGRLGFHRAIVLVEDGVEPFSNLQGVQQIRYPQGQISTTFGEVLATLRREFGQ